MKKNTLISYKDILLILILLLISVIGIIITHNFKKNGKKVNLSVDGKIVECFSLDKDLEYTFKTKEGYNVIVINDGEVYVKEADCKDKICVKHSHINKLGETIICLPHKLILEIVE